MHGIERFLVVGAIANMAVYLSSMLIICLLIGDSAILQYSYIIFPWHFVGMFINFIAFVLTIRDLYKRPFPKDNDKLTWAILILTTGGIGWAFYIFKHALKPRGGINVLEDQ